MSFSSQTDSECIPHLIEDYLNSGCSLEEATRMAAGKLRGANATAVFSTREPDRIVAFRLGNAGGIIVGRTGDGGLLSSDLSALLPHTREVVYLSGGEMASIGPEGTTFRNIHRWQPHRQEGDTNTRSTRSRRKRAGSSTSCTRRFTTSLSR